MAAINEAHHLSRSSTVAASKKEPPSLGPHQNSDKLKVGYQAPNGFPAPIKIDSCFDDWSLLSARPELSFRVGTDCSLRIGSRRNEPPRNGACGSRFGQSLELVMPEFR
jgi:hypothetical protein